jgi:hypothetical protein
MCFVWISEQTAIISLYSINWLVFITETECVYCAVRAGSLNTFQITFRLLFSFHAPNHQRAPRRTQSIGGTKLIPTLDQIEGPHDACHTSSIIRHRIVHTEISRLLLLLALLHAKFKNVTASAASAATTYRIRNCVLAVTTRRQAQKP